MTRCEHRRSEFTGRVITSMSRSQPRPSATTTSPPLVCERVRRNRRQSAPQSRAAESELSTMSRDICRRRLETSEARGESGVRSPHEARRELGCLRTWCPELSCGGHRESGEPRHRNRLSRRPLPWRSGRRRWGQKTTAAASGSTAVTALVGTHRVGVYAAGGS